MDKLKSLNNSMKTLWQYFTPTNIVSFIIKTLLENKKDKQISILEPSMWDWQFIKELIKIWYTNITWIEIDKNIKINQKENIKIYNNDFFEIKDKIWKYDLIIWNPPYVKNTEIYNSTKELLEKQYWSINYNLYYYFIMSSIDLLKENGELIFLVPINFLYNTLAKGLRKKILDNWYIDKIIDFGEIKIFDDASVEVIAFRFIKNKDKIKNKIEILEIKDKQKRELSWNFNLEMFNNYKIEQFNNYNTIWNINKKKENFNYKKPITDIFDIYVWLVSGLDKAFLIEDNELLKFNKNEKNLVFNFIKAKNSINYKDHNKFNKYIFIEQWKINNEKELKEYYPNIFNKLKEYKEQLLKRYWTKNKKYWEWATIRNLDKNKWYKEKIFIPNVSRKENQAFTYNDKGYYISGDVCALSIKKDINLSKEEKEKYIKLLLSNDYTKYINQNVPKKWNRKLFSYKFLESLKI